MAGLTSSPNACSGRHASLGRPVAVQAPLACSAQHSYLRLECLHEVVPVAAVAEPSLQRNSQATTLWLGKLPV
jgi:hypothetical protein